MIKVSFNDYSYKKTERFNDKVTIVTLTGKAKLSDLLVHAMPMKFIKWVGSYQNPKINYDCMGTMYIIAKGKTVRHDKDKDNPVLAERIAESKAKLKIYRFVFTLIKKYIKTYEKILTGHEGSLIIKDEVAAASLLSTLDKYDGFIIKEVQHLRDLIKQSCN